MQEVKCNISNSASQRQKISKKRTSNRQVVFSNHILIRTVGGMPRLSRGGGIMRGAGPGPPRSSITSRRTDDVCHLCPKSVHFVFVGQSIGFQGGGLHGPREGDQRHRIGGYVRGREKCDGPRPPTKRYYQPQDVEELKAIIAHCHATKQKVRPAGAVCPLTAEHSPHS